MSVNGKFGNCFPAFGAPTPSCNLNLILYFSDSRQEATSAFSFLKLLTLHILATQKVHVTLFMPQAKKFLKCDLRKQVVFN